MPFVLGLLSVVAVLSSILLAFVVLLQEPKGGGIAAALGGSGMEAIGPATGGVNRFTVWVATIWMVACFLHAIGMRTGAELGAKPAEPAAEKDKGAQLPQSSGGNAPAPANGNAPAPSDGNKPAPGGEKPAEKQEPPK
jgi:preprotein translocase subunit SecG